jgi:hypothetical protein
MKFLAEIELLREPLNAVFPKPFSISAKPITNTSIPV